MKTGRTLVELAQEVTRQNESKKDYLADTAALRMEPDLKISGFNGVALAVKPTAHAQIGQHVGIPKAYYDRLLQEAPALLAENVNHWFAAQPEKRMVRTLDGEVRGVLSSRYRAMDNWDILQAAMPVLHGKNAVFKSCEITDRHMFLKIVFPDLVMEVPGTKVVGDLVEVGLSIRNSEIGFSSFAVEPFIHRLICTNGMISNYSQKKYHVGKRQDSENAVDEILRDETLHQRDKAFWMQIQDVIASAVNRDVLQQHVRKFSEAAAIKITVDPVQLIESTKKQFSLSDETGGDILRHLIEAGDLSKWGLANAITRTAQDQADYEDATHLERLGGKVIELTPKDWSVINVKAS